MINENSSGKPIVNVVAERPHFGSRQVRTKKGLKIGHYYRLVGKNRYTIKILTPIRKDECGEFVEVEFFFGDRRKQRDWKAEYLANCGIVPYEGEFGGWNPTNHLLRL